MHQVDEAVPGLGLAEGDGDLAEVPLLPVAKPPALDDLLARYVLQGLAVDVPVEHRERPGLGFDLRRGPAEVHHAIPIHERVADVLGPAVEPLGEPDGVRLLRQWRGLVGPGLLLLLGVALDVSGLLVPEILAGRGLGPGRGVFRLVGVRALAARSARGELLLELRDPLVHLGQGDEPHDLLDPPVVGSLPAGEHPGFVLLPRVLVGDVGEVHVALDHLVVLRDGTLVPDLQVELVAADDFPFAPVDVRLAGQRGDPDAPALDAAVLELDRADEIREALSGPPEGVLLLPVPAVDVGTVLSLGDDPAIVALADLGHITRCFTRSTCRERGARWKWRSGVNEGRGKCP